MGIYIKGVDIPTNCTDCRYMPLVGCNPYQDNGMSPSDHRHRTCPLTEVAEPHGHGRLIDAEDAIECVRCGWSVTDVIDRINALPSADAEWIPCKEGLPKENEYVGNVRKYYLIQDEYGDMHVAHLSGRGWETIESVKALGCDVVAWMPSPKPYREGGEV